MYLPRWMVGACALVACLWGRAVAQPSFVFHDPTGQVYGEAAGVTMREPDVPREDEQLALWIKTGPSFSYDQVAVYYTVNGSEPAGTLGVGNVGTLVLRSVGPTPPITFVRNEPGVSGNDDWWKANFTALFQHKVGTVIKYKVSAWRNAPPQGELFSATFTFTVKIAWPGAGAGSGTPSAGYPDVSFWKEEAIFGNQYCAGQIDQNGTYYDFHFPTPGGVHGVGTRNDGYVDGLDTFPPGLPVAWRGQMHLNQAMVGLRVDGLTHWTSNPNGVSYDSVSQFYRPDSNSITTESRLFYGGNNIAVQQIDFAPYGVGFPSNAYGSPERHVAVKRVILTNNGGAAKTINVYFSMDPAINGGDGYDSMFFDATRGAMTAFDKTTRDVTGTGTGFTPPNEYNPTTAASYRKNNALYLSAAMKKLASVGGAGGTPATESWRDTSSDQGQGWIGQQVVLNPGASVEVDVALAGCHFRPADPFVDPMPVFDGVYDNQCAPLLNWFVSGSAAGLQATTDAAWADWLSAGVGFDSPDDEFDALFKRGLLATALHVDGFNGGVIAGFHNGAYPYVWPRDAVYAAVTLARTGHLAGAAGVYEWMRDTCYRDFEAWGRKGFWKQKYSTDGYVIWGAPQIDETAVFPWGVHYQYLMTADTAFLNSYLEQVRDSVLTMTSDSFDSRLRWEEAFNLSYSNNVWEDSFDTFIYSNANIHRGLDDARRIFDALGLPAEAFDAFTLRNAVKSGLDARLDWDGENTDVSQLGIVYPFGVYGATDTRAARVANRINGITRKFNDTHCCVEPLVNFAGQHQDTINRYWGDGYWNGGPWFLSTLWYGLFYAERADQTSGKADIDNHKYRLDLMVDRLGPVGLGAEQIAYDNSLLYPGQSDLVLQTAWPNAWESMSTFVDALMAFADFKPNAPLERVELSPKLPTGWGSMTFSNIAVTHTPSGRVHALDMTVTESGVCQEVVLTNRTGEATGIDLFLKADPLQTVFSVARDGNDIAYTLDGTGRVDVEPFDLNTGPGATTTIRVNYAPKCLDLDFNNDGIYPDTTDLLDYLNVFGGGGCSTGQCDGIDFNQDGIYPDTLDLELFLAVFGGGSC